MEIFLQLVFALFGLLASYWVIRWAVRHALEDADRRREKARISAERDSLD